MPENEPARHRKGRGPGAVDSGLECKLDHTLADLFTPGGVHELRVPKAGRLRTISGYFDDPCKLAAAAAQVDQAERPSGIYFTANPVKPSLLARNANVAQPYVDTTTADHDIARRRWLIADLDPVRPAGVPSTDAEHVAAGELAVEIKARLAELGWPDPVVMDSGNGWYLLYLVDLPNDDDALGLVKGCLAGLAERFDNEVVTVDQTMCSAAQLIRVPGTLNRKGSGTADRPHRVAEIVAVPGELVPVPVELLAAMAPPSATSSSSSSSSNSRFDLEGFVAEHLPDARGPKDKPDGGRLWELEDCPFHPDHGGHQAYVGQMPSGALYAGCHHNSCEWQWPELRKMFDPGPSAAGGGSDRYFAGKQGLKAITLAHDIMALGRLAQGTDDILWSYEGGVYRPARHVARDRAVDLLGERFRESYARNAEAVIRRHAPVITCEPVGEVLNFGNGLNYWRLGEMRDHDPAVMTTVQLGVDWNPEATCPEFDTWLDQVVPADMVPVVWELIGYLMFSGNPLHKAVMLTGTGRNGKGTFLRVMVALLGQRNVTSVSLHDLVNTRFAGASLFGKLANIAGDIDGTFIENTAVIKAVTGGDLVSAEHKGRDRFDFHPWCVPVFSANKVPASADTTDGYLSRWLVIPFPHSFRGREDRTLDYRLTTKAELQGIAVKAVAALPGLLVRGDFKLPESGQEAYDEFVRRVDQVQVWIEEHADLHPGHPFTSRPPLHANYKAWAIGQGYRNPIKATEFYDRLARAGAVPTIRDGDRGFTGIKLVAGGAPPAHGLPSDGR